MQITGHNETQKKLSCQAGGSCLRHFQASSLHASRAAGQAMQQYLQDERHSRPLESLERVKIEELSRENGGIHCSKQLRGKGLRPLPFRVRTPGHPNASTAVTPVGQIMNSISFVLGFLLLFCSALDQSEKVLTLQLVLTTSPGLPDERAIDLEQPTTNVMNAVNPRSSTLRLAIAWVPGCCHALRGRTSALSSGLGRACRAKMSRVIALAAIQNLT